MDDVDVLIVGAGLAGLSCARALADAGKRVRVLERSKFVGGRCASKALQGSVVDFGPIFVHGDDPDFLSWVASMEFELIPGWPRVKEGSGTPCLPQAFAPLQRRYAVKSGIRCLAESLAAGLDVQTETQVDSLVWGSSTCEAVTSDGRRFGGSHLVVAVALEQAKALLSPLVSGPGAEVVRKAQALLDQFASLPCLTVMADYPLGTSAPAWDVWYPENSRSLLVGSNEGAKRPSGLGPRLVFQARPAWSADRIEQPKDSWTQELLEEAGRLLGSWASAPTSLLAHRWRYARLGPSDHLFQPIVLDQAASSSRIGLVGDLFDTAGGLQGAWLSGRKLARRWTDVG